jgi:hypothetical protein
MSTSMAPDKQKDPQGPGTYRKGHKVAQQEGLEPKWQRGIGLAKPEPGESIQRVQGARGHEFEGLPTRFYRAAVTVIKGTFRLI